MPVDQKAARVIAEKGEEIYAETIRPLIDFEQERGKFVVIDVNSGAYEIDKRDAVASRRLHERCPNGVFYGVRIGFAAAYRMCGRYRLREYDLREG